MIADEPTTALDVTIQARIVRLIAEMQARDDTAVVFITHDLRLAAQVCDEILVLYAGRTAEYGPARRVFAAPRPSLHALPAAREPRDERHAARALRAARAHARACAPTATSAAAASRRAARSRSRNAAHRPPLVEVGAGHCAACIRAEPDAPRLRRTA